MTIALGIFGLLLIIQSIRLVRADRIVERRLSTLNQIIDRGKVTNE